MLSAWLRLKYILLAIKRVTHFSEKFSFEKQQSYVTPMNTVAQ
jgi:hypothetical protein